VWWSDARGVSASTTIFWDLVRSSTRDEISQRLRPPSRTRVQGSRPITRPGLFCVNNDFRGGMSHCASQGSGQVLALRPQDCFLCAKDVTCPPVRLYVRRPGVTDDATRRNWRRRGCNTVRWGRKGPRSCDNSLSVDNPSPRRQIHLRQLRLSRSPVGRNESVSESVRGSSPLVSCRPESNQGRPCQLGVGDRVLIGLPIWR
jgi:hypothetical protein